ncbi:TlpA family protein disulfide reductase [Aureibaculum conchae]|uniref:TlpA family protein disulfide reductase n=1 Tax=Aureibaculum sp. 2308TA14-22 TaxID=3108392 RepID=UPI0033933FB3
MKKIIYLILIFLLTICTEKNQIEHYSIQLGKTSKRNIAFNSMTNTFMASSIKHSYPLYYEYLKNNVKNFKQDSSYISSLILDNKRFKYELYQMGMINKQKIIDLKIDTSSEKRKIYMKPMNFLVEYRNGKENVTLDKNNNNFFKDDESVVFDNNFRINNSELDIDDLRTYKVGFYNNIKEKTSITDREVLFYPNSYSSYNGSLSSNENINRSRIHIRFKDYWEGNIRFTKRKYVVAVQGIYPYLSILVKPDSLPFSNSSSDYNFNFEYKIKDTVKIENQFYILDSINNSVTELFLKKINLDKPFYSHKLGYKIYNLKFNDLTNSFTYNLYDNEYFSKKYTLLEFWGTWCKPCIKTTPRLKKLYTNYKKEVDILGIAYDRDINTVKKYIDDNNIPWKQTFVDVKNKKKPIISKLNIGKYPTFILVDNSTKMIIYRGVGEDALYNLDKILEDKK